MKKTLAITLIFCRKLWKGVTAPKVLNGFEVMSETEKIKAYSLWDTWLTISSTSLSSFFLADKAIISLNYLMFREHWHVCQLRNKSVNKSINDVPCSAAGH